MHNIDTPARRVLSYMLAASLAGVMCISGCLAQGASLESIGPAEPQVTLAIASHASPHDCCPAPAGKEHREDNPRMSCCMPDGEVSIAPQRLEPLHLLTVTYFVDAAEQEVSFSYTLSAATAPPLPAEALYVRNRVFRI